MILARRRLLFVGSAFQPERRLWSFLAVFG